MTLSTTAQRFQDVLREQGWSHTVVEMPATTRTATDAARACGCDVGQIVKSLIFETAQTHRPLLVLASGANRVDEKLVQSMIGESLKKADAEFVRQHTGYVIGGVPPTAHVEPIETIMDSDLLLHTTLWAAAGTPNAVFCLTPGELQSMTGARIVDIKK